ncbi:MAG: ATP-dependent DNA helicase RecG [Eubacteriales bacterium]
MDLSSKVSELKGVGEARAKKLAKMDIVTVADLLAHFPKGYEDRREIHEICTAPIGETVCIKATAVEHPRLQNVRRGLDLVQIKVSDRRSSLHISIFNQPYAMSFLRAGTEYLFCGAVSQQYGRFTMTNPVFERVGEQTFTGRLVPKYHLTSGVSNLLLSVMMREALDHCGKNVEDTLPKALSSTMKDPVFAYENIHFPADDEALECARERLAFEELFYLSIGLSRLKGRREEGSRPPIPTLPIDEFPVPFELTGAQRRVMEEMARDMLSGRAMNRLVQGDVGSGKTAVAAYGAHLAVANGHQVAMMVPTEVLANQHFRSLETLLKPLDIKVGVLTASLSAKEKRQVLKNLKDGTIQFVIGTHALLSKGVEFSDLALVIADEQHRFGVDQRAALSAKAQGAPHILVMSATPIPRTLALMIYGDLEVSVIDELPPNRTPIETYVVGEDKRARMMAFVDKQITEGRQVYIVCPAVEEKTDDTSEGPDLKAVTVYVEELQSKVFPQYRLAFLHGKRKPKEKEAVMAGFKGGEIDILVSTTVIEVGVDVPNANLIIIENADRFGLSQLHQLRGRVGRGEHKSYCVLITSTRNTDTLHRLNTLASTTDGFKISEEDLKIRGPGDFFGSRQHGLPSLKLADLSGDMRTLSSAQESARTLLEADPDLTNPEHAGVKKRVEAIFEQTADIFN